MNQHGKLRIDFIGLGAQKAATSWLAECLQEHPAVYLCPGKEVHFFSTNTLYEQGMLAYEKRFGDIPSGRKVGEFSTTYLCNVDAPQRIHDLFPDVRLIVSLRNPVDRALSHIEHLISRGILSRGISVEDAIRERRDIVEHGMYGAALNRYLALFPKAQMHIVFFDDIVADPKKVVRDVYGFVGVDSSYMPRSLMQKFNTAEIRSSPIYRAANRVHFALGRSQLGVFVRTALKSSGITHQRLVKILGVLQPKTEYVRSGDRDRLQELFHSDIELLERTLSVRLDSWKSKKTV